MAATPLFETSSAASNMRAGLPPMRFEGGDVAIQLSHDNSETLLLHSKFLAAKLHMFKAGTKPDWNKARTFANPISGELLEIFPYAVVAKGGTFTLEQGVEYCDMELDDEDQIIASVPFVDSQLSPFHIQASIPTPRFGWSQVASHNVKLFLALIYDLPVSLEDVIADSELVNEDCTIWGLADFVAHRVAEIFALAESNLVKDEIRTKLSKMLLESPRVWELVNYNPRTYLTLAKWLKCKPLYYDALRNFLATMRDSHPPSIEALAETMEISEEQVNVIIEQHKEARRSAEARLCQELHNLALADVQNTEDPERPTTWRTTFINAHHHRAEKPTKLQQRSEFIARSIWGQHLIQRFDANGTILIRSRSGPGSGDTKPIPVPSFVDTIETLLQAPTSEDPSEIFGFKVLEGYVAMFGKNVIDMEGIRDQLISIIDEAAEVIKKWGAGYDNGTESGKAANCGIIKERVITWARIPHEMPWEETADAQTSDDSAPEEGSVSQETGAEAVASAAAARRMTAAPKDEKDPPQVSLEPASQEWLQAVGLL